MAERRMFAKTIIDSDAFLDMPLSTQALYFHLSMRADDDGFVNNPKKIQRMIGASDDDMRVLVGKRFLIVFESGIVVIKHWRIHNYIQKDRYKETAYTEEKAMLSLKDNNAYTLETMDTECIQDVSKVEAQVRIGKDSIDKDRLEIDKKRTRFTPPSLSEVQEYVKERNSQVDPKQFYEYFEAGEWKDSKGNQVKNWKQKLITWEKFNIKEAPKRTMNNFTSSDTTEEDLDDWSKKNQDDFYSRWGGDE